jgi:hypothetical protein
VAITARCVRSSSGGWPSPRTPRLAASCCGSWWTWPTGRWRTPSSLPTPSKKLAELDPRDRALRTELLERLGRVGRYRAIADVRRWEITSLETLAERKRALDALLLLAEEHPFDAAALAAALQAYRAADPTDVDARAALVKFLRGAGQLEEAAALVRESVRAAQDSESRQAALTELADIYDVGLRQDEPARAATLQILELAQFDEAAIERLERIALRSGAERLAGGGPRAPRQGGARRRAGRGLPAPRAAL